MYAAELSTTVPAASDVNRATLTSAGVTLQSSAQEPRDLYSLMEDYERRLILLALQAAGGHQRRAAASLGVLPSTLSEKLRRLGLRVKTRAPRSRRSLDRASLPELGGALT